MQLHLHRCTNRRRSATKLGTECSTPGPGLQQPPHRRRTRNPALRTCRERTSPATYDVCSTSCLGAVGSPRRRCTNSSHCNETDHPASRRIVRLRLKCGRHPARGRGRSDVRLEAAPPLCTSSLLECCIVHRCGLSHPRIGWHAAIPTLQDGPQTPPSARNSVAQVAATDGENCVDPPLRPFVGPLRPTQWFLTGTRSSSPGQDRQQPLCRWSQHSPFRCIYPYCPQDNQPPFCFLDP